MTPQEARKAWVEALRSGDYKQGEGVLRDGDGNYCCLGVACELAVKDGVEMDVYTPEDGSTLYDGQAIVCPRKVQDWLRLAERHGAHRDHVSRDTRYLTTLNDNGATFAEIADLIESEPKGLFA
jgi:hypothetical protein